MRPSLLYFPGDRLPGRPPPEQAPAERLLADPPGPAGGGRRGGRRLALQVPAHRGRAGAEDGGAPQRRVRGGGVRVQGLLGRAAGGEQVSGRGDRKVCDFTILNLDTEVVNCSKLQDLH